MPASPFQTEAWSEYGVGLLILLLRIAYRCRCCVGWRWDGDDWFALAAVFFWTGELCMLELIGQYGSITGITDEAALAMTPEQVERTVVGSKCLLAGWCLYVTLIWCLKACMLFMFARLTLNLSQQKLVKVTAALSALAYVATMIVILTKCQPFEANWQVYPYPGDACSLNVPNYLALVVTNVTTDLMIMYIPIPVLWGSKMPLKRKITYGSWLGTGVFIIAATLLRCVLCLGDVSSINLGTIWSIRETFVGIAAVNFIILLPAARQATARLRDGFVSVVARSSSAVRGGGGGGGGGKGEGAGSSYYKRSGGGGDGGEHELTRIERRDKMNRIRRGLGWTSLAEGTAVDGGTRAGQATTTTNESQLDLARGDTGGSTAGGDGGGDSLREDSVERCERGEAPGPGPGLGG